MYKTIRAKIKRDFDKDTGYCIEYKFNDDDVLVERGRFQLGELKISEIDNIEVRMFEIMSDISTNSFAFHKIVDTKKLHNNVVDHSHTSLTETNNSTTLLIRTLKKRIKSVTRKYKHFKDKGYKGLLDEWFWVMNYMMDNFALENQQLYDKLNEYNKSIEKAKESIYYFSEFYE